MSTFRSSLVLVGVLLSVLGCAAEPEPELSERARSTLPVPAKLQGVWAQVGKCNSAQDRTVIRARTLRWGAGEPEVVGYAEIDGDPDIHDPDVTATIFFPQEEGVLSYYDYSDKTPDRMIFLPEGPRGPWEEWERCR